MKTFAHTQAGLSALKMALTIGLTLAVASSATADDSTREERLAVATEYVQTTMEDMDMDRILEQMYQPILAQIEASGRQVTQGQVDALQQLYRDEMLEPLRDIMLAQDEIMADIMTMDEIVAIQEFYATDVGRSVMTKLPDILAVQQPMIVDLVTAKLPQMMPRIQAIAFGN